MAFGLGLGLIAACQSEVPIGYGSTSGALGGVGQPPHADGSCNDSLVACGGTCADVATDVNHCGGCANICAVGATCALGTCTGGSAPDPTPDPTRDPDPTPDPDPKPSPPTGKPQVLASGLSFANGIAVRGDFVYVTEQNLPAGPTAQGRVLRIPRLGGTATALATGQDNPQAIAVNDTHAYWTNAGHVDDMSQKYQFGEVKRVALPGGASPETLATGEVWSFQLGLDASHVYWVDNSWSGADPDPNPEAHGVFRAAHDGSNRTRLSHLGGNAGHHVGLSGSEVFWTGGTAGVYRQSKSGSSLAPQWLWQAPDASIPWDLALDGGFAYWTNKNTQALMRAPLAGGAPAVLASGNGTPGGVAVDGKHVYFASCPSAQVGPCSLQRVPIAGGATETLATGYDWMRFVATDADAVYFTTADSVVRVTK